MTKFVTFETSQTPTDPEDEQGAAKPVLERIASGLRASGVHITTPIAEWGDYGWYIEVSVGDVRLTCMIQRSDDWLLLLSSHRSFTDRLMGRNHEAELRKFAASVVSVVEDTFEVPVRLFQNETAFRAG